MAVAEPAMSQNCIIERLRTAYFREHARAEFKRFPGAFRLLCFRIFGRLAKSCPGNAGWQRDLIVSYKKIADCARPKGVPISRALEIAKAK
jgi:hypothetical protein